MKKLITIFTMLISCYSFSQEVNPWKSIGKEAPEILTLSDGKYPEIFENDSIRIINGIVYNIITRKVIGFIETDTLYSEATLEPEIVSRWLSTDPLAAKYPSHSPYNFVGNMPIIAIDPDGREIYIVIGKNESGQEEKIRYIPGMSSENLGEFAGNAIKVLNYLHKNVDANKINFLASSRYATTLNIRENNNGTNEIGSAEGADVRLDIKWDDNKILKDESGVYLSPATLLAHELDHGWIKMYYFTQAELLDTEEAWEKYYNVTDLGDPDLCNEEQRASAGDDSFEVSIKKSLGRTEFRTHHTARDSKEPFTHTDDVFSIDGSPIEKKESHFLERKSTIPSVESENKL